MENCLGAENVKINSGFELTSKVISTAAFDTKTEKTLENYSSTEKQTNIATKEENNAIRSLALAGFSLNSNGALNKYNSFMLKQQMSA